MLEQGRIFSRNNGSSVRSWYELLNLKKPCFLSFFATELSYLVDIFSSCSKDDCVGTLFRTHLQLHTLESRIVGYGRLVFSRFFFPLKPS